MKNSTVSDDVLTDHFGNLLSDSTDQFEFSEIRLQFSIIGPRPPDLTNVREGDNIILWTSQSASVGDRPYSPGANRRGTVRCREGRV